MREPIDVVYAEVKIIKINFTWTAGAVRAVQLVQPSLPPAAPDEAQPQWPQQRWRLTSELRAHGRMFVHAKHRVLS